jgi:hypothetical protein
MMRPAHIAACVCLLFPAGLAVAQSQPAAGEWVSYRDAYRAMVLFDKYGGAKNLLQNHLGVVPKEKGALGEGVQLVLSGKSVQANLPLDATGRGALPLLKAAYDENAVLAPNRRLGGFTIRPRVSIAAQADGAYEVAELRAACEQALGYAGYVDPRARGRQCVGVRFVFAKKGVEASARLRRADGAEQALAVTRGPAFAGDLEDDFPVVNFRFGGAEKAQVIAYNAPLAIVPVFE